LLAKIRVGRVTVNTHIFFFGLIRIECILLKFHWGMKALIELDF
jgi:hypothetical protein